MALVVLYAQDVRAVVSVAAGPPGWGGGLSLPVLWDTLHPQPRTTACLGLPKQTLCAYKHTEISKYTSLEKHTSEPSESKTCCLPSVKAWLAQVSAIPKSC